MDRQLDVKLFIRAINLFVLLVLLLVGFICAILGITVYGPEKIMARVPVNIPAENNQKPVTPDVWAAPDPASIPDNEEGKLIRYGRELIAHTAAYLGPQGKVMRISNGMNCQNCHLDAGTKPFGNNYSAVASTYPKFRPRSGTIESIEKRVNDCFERSLNGKPLAEDSHEMKAIVAYIKWLGKDVPKGETPKGAGLVELSYLDIPADPVKGKSLYEQKCTVCHGASGEGVKNPGATEYTYPPLWGEHSYNTGAGLYRLSRFAGYIKANMPLGATYAEPQLTDEEAWHIAAYVNSLPRRAWTFRKTGPIFRKNR